MSSCRTAVNVAVGLALLMLLSTANAQSCSSGRYGSDCSCTGNLVPLGFDASDCSAGTWTWRESTSLVINQAVDLMYDTMIVPDFGTNAAIQLPEFGNLTLHIYEYANGTLRQGNFSTPGIFEATNGTVHLMFDNQERAAWSIQFATYGSLVGSPKLTVRTAASQYRCRAATTPASGTVFLDQEARYTYNVTNTRSRCGFAKGSRDWAMWIWCAIAGLGVLLIFFTIISCCIHPLKKKVWYPPM